MGNRLSKIATRTGDAGTTGLTDGSRIPKHHLRVCAMGDVDELNSQIGVVLTHSLPEPVRDRLASTQRALKEALTIGPKGCVIAIIGEIFVVFAQSLVEFQA